MEPLWRKSERQREGVRTKEVCILREAHANECRPGADPLLDLDE